MSLKTSSYNFTLPPELIATSPASPRDSARLLVYNIKKDEITHTHFSDIERFIPKKCTLILNDTKVIKARVFGNKSSGAKIELLINKSLDAYRTECYIKGRVKVGSVIIFDEQLSATVLSLESDSSRIVTFSKNNQPIRFEALLGELDKIGHMPLPPYIKRADCVSDEVDYQTVFACHDGAVAAPTASLHFSDNLYKSVCSKFDTAFVTLHVGAGTFKPVACETITDHPMHSEYYNIPSKTQSLLESTQEILCVGTTTARTVEYFERTKKHSGEADLFLHPQNRPQRVQHLLTNFHLPASTLLMLVASFIGLEKTKELYATAIKERYRFYSYGDAMLIIQGDSDG